MKSKIITFAFAMYAFFVIGCAGTPVAVNRFGNVQPAVLIYEQQRDITVTEFGSSTTLFNFNGFWPKQMPMTFTLPYNQDWSLTLFNFKNAWFKLMPMTDGRFWGF